MRRSLTALIAVAALAGSMPASSASSAAATASGWSAPVATPGAAYPTISEGNSGEDVRAAQRLLRHHGYAARTDGRFDDQMDTTIRNFQADKGLGVDGIVGPQTWGALAITLRKGDAGEGVIAVQRLLNTKGPTHLPLSGFFNQRLENAVIGFQQHAVIAADGVVDSDTWINLLWHYQQAPMGNILCGVASADRQWGTGSTTAQLHTAGKLFVPTGNGKVSIGDISWEHGGPLSGHVSHDIGMDIDIGPIRNDSDQCRSWTTWNSPDYDAAATRLLVEAIYDAAPGKVKVIWFNDPALIADGLTEYLENHDNHLHVRYCVDYYPGEINYVCDTGYTFGPELPDGG